MMLEETGTVMAVQGEYAWIETQAKSACAHCHSGDSCGTSALGKWFARKRNRILVRNHLGLKEGDSAVIGIRGDRLVKAALLAYLWPLVLMIIFSGMASVVEVSDSAVALSALIGLVLGMVSIKIMSDNSKTEAVSLIRRAGFGQQIIVDSNFIK